MKGIIVGFGGHAKVIVDIIKDKYNIIGYADMFNKNVELEYLGDDNELINYLKANNDNINLFLGLSYLGKKLDLTLRKQVIDFYRNKGYNFTTILSNKAILSANVTIGNGSFIGNGVVINPNTYIGKNTIINTGAIIEHDIQIGKNSQIAPGAIILGGSSIGNNTFIGAGAIVRDSVKIGNNIIIGMGSIVTEDIQKEGIYFGNPLKKYK